MGDVWLDLTIVLGLVAVNAMLSGTEMALVSLRRGQLDAMSASGRRGQRVAALAHSPGRYLSAIQLGITLAGFLASASAAVELSDSVAPALDFLGGSARGASIILITVLVSLITLVFGELVPKRIAMAHAQQWSLAAVVPLTWFMTAVRPILRVLEICTDAVLRLTGTAADGRADEMTDDEIVHLIEARPSLDPSQRQIMAEAIATGGRTLRHILVPRTLVISVDVADSVEAAVAALRDAGVSRAPLVKRDLDHPVGQVNVLDLIHATGTAADCARPVLALPESLSAFRALRRLQASQTKLAVVVDEHGGTEGIVTVEDIIEELVGDISDEADPQQSVGTPDPSGAIVLPGTFPIHRMDELDVQLPSGRYVTVAGLVLDRLGHLPEVGEHVEVGNYDLVVTGTDRTSITAVTIRTLEPLPN